MSFVAGLGVGFVIGASLCSASFLWATLKDEGWIP